MSSPTTRNVGLEEIMQDDKETCAFCRLQKVDVLNYGPMYKLEDVTTHYFCLLFSSALMPKGEDHEGILGYQLEDIRKELNRGKYLRCMYCRKYKATIGCCTRKCKDSFHFPCGLRNGVSFIFNDRFLSFCPKHKAPTAKICLSKSKGICMICLENITKRKDIISPPCCLSKEGNVNIFHKTCVKKQALFQGSYHFKCPACASKKKFKRFMEKNGVYVPIRDASWELEPSAYERLNEKYSRCDQAECLCPFGREYNSSKMKLKRNDESKKWWKIIRCGACAAGAVHMKCGNLENLSYKCQVCGPAIQQYNTNKHD